MYAGQLSSFKSCLAPSLVVGCLHTFPLKTAIAVQQFFFCHPHKKKLMRNILPHPHPIPPNIAQHSGWDKKTSFPIPTQTEKQPKPKNQPPPQTPDGMGILLRIPSPQRTKKEKASNICYRNYRSYNCC